MEIHFFEPQSLKEKRFLLKSLTDRIRKKFNVSIAEIDGMDLWQATTLAIATVAGEAKRVNQILDLVREFIRNERGLEISREHLEIL